MYGSTDQRFDITDCCTALSVPDQHQPPDDVRFASRLSYPPSLSCCKRPVSMLDSPTRTSLNTAYVHPRSLGLTCVAEPGYQLRVASDLNLTMSLTLSPFCSSTDMYSSKITS